MLSWTEVSQTFTVAHKYLGVVAADAGTAVTAQQASTSAVANTRIIGTVTLAT
jgi:hypothetical protein